MGVLVCVCSCLLVCACARPRRVRVCVCVRVCVRVRVRACVRARVVCAHLSGLWSRAHGLVSVRARVRVRLRFAPACVCHRAVRGAGRRRQSAWKLFQTPTHFNIRGVDVCRRTSVQLRHLVPRHLGEHVSGLPACSEKGHFGKVSGFIWGYWVHWFSRLGSLGSLGSLASLASFGFSGLCGLCGFSGSLVLWALWVQWLCGLWRPATWFVLCAH